jgi:hypothetical protein
MRVRHLAASPTHTKRTDGETVVTEHLLIVTTDGRVFERFSDDRPGAWSEVPLPQQAKRLRKYTRNSRKKQLRNHR